MQKNERSWRQDLKGWQRLCMTLLAGAVLGILTWIFCTFIAKPVYTDSTAKVSLRAEGYNFDTVMRFYGDNGLQILEGLKEELEGDAYLKKVGASLPKGMTMEEDKVQWTEPLDNRNLECTVQLLPPEEKQRTKWISHKLVVDEPEEDWEW